MNPPEARFILRAHRADGRYHASDPLFADALAEAGRAPELGAWLAREHAFDEAITNKLAALAPPAGLRESILVGARASRARRHWWEKPGWLMAAAAGITIAFSIPALLRQADPASQVVAALGGFALNDLGSRAHAHDYGAPLAAIEATLAARTQPLSSGLDLDVEKLRAAGCAALRFADREVFEVCFQRDGTWFHLYVTRVDRTGPAGADRLPVFTAQDDLAAATWTDGAHVFTLATRAGAGALRRVV